MVFIVIALTILSIVLLIALICAHLINKSLAIYLKKIDRHPTDEELNACVKEAIKTFME